MSPRISSCNLKLGTERANARSNTCQGREDRHILTWAACFPVPRSRKKRIMLSWSPSSSSSPSTKKQTLAWDSPVSSRRRKLLVSSGPVHSKPIAILSFEVMPDSFCQRRGKAVGMLSG